ncbi:hypothetical protein EDB85DRAFT_2181664 [Lactarius pseudohatsudake]|nr:hypothetical protein EDB85DRAFT_2181664 [Lactarius pseudohatsudake]
MYATSLSPSFSLIDTCPQFDAWNLRTRSGRRHGLRQFDHVRTLYEKYIEFDAARNWIRDTGGDTGSGASEHSMRIRPPQTPQPGQGLSKPALQGIVGAQKDKWPASVHGKFTQKTNMATMRAALLDPEHGFTVQILEPVQSKGQDDGQIGRKPTQTSQTTAMPYWPHALQATISRYRGGGNKDQAVAALSADWPVEGLATEGVAINSNKPDDRRAYSCVRGSPDKDRTVGTVNAGRPVEGAAINLNEPDDRHAMPVQSKDVMRVTTGGPTMTGGAVIELNEPSAFMSDAAIDPNEPGPGPNYALDELDPIDPASYAPFGTGQGHLFNGSNHGRSLEFDISDYKMTDLSGNDKVDNTSFTDPPSTFTDSAKLDYPMTSTFCGTSRAPTGQQDCSTAVGVKPVGRSRDPARQPSSSSVRAKTAFLEGELATRSGYDDFCSTFNHVRDNLSAVRSWTFAVDFMRAYNKVCLIEGVYRKIPKDVIKMSLNVGPTWFCDATKAVGIVQKYGEGGTHRSQQVIDKIACTSEGPGGSTKLFDWLKAWEDDHPI